MLVHLKDHLILSRIFSGNRLIITFQNKMDILDKQVVELTEVVGFIDQSTSNEFQFLRIDESGSSYAYDLSLRLHRPEIIDFQETFLFTDSACTQFSFRACAKDIRFRKWLEEDSWLK